MEPQKQPVSIVWKYALVGLKWGIYGGIGLKCLDTFITLLRVNVLVAILFLIAAGICFIPKVGVGVAVVVAFIMSQFTGLNLFLVFLAAALIGSILGALPGMAIGAAIGLVRKRASADTADVPAKSGAVILKSLVLPLIGAIALFSLYFGIVNPWLSRTVLGSDSGPAQETSVATTTHTTTTTIATGTISGRVIDDNKKPIKGVEVTADPGGPGQRQVFVATTDSSGNYKITGINSGEYQIYVQSTGWVTQYWQNANFYSSVKVTSVPVAVTSNITGINFTLEKSGIISGTVTDASGKPLANIGVDIKIANSNTSYLLPTDQNGFFSSQGNNFPLGSYTVSAPDVTRQYSQDDSYITKSEQVTMSAKTPDAKGTNFTLDIGGSISGQVRDENNQPISGVDMSAYVSGVTGPEVSTAWTDTSGHYQIKGLASGNYIISAYLKGWIRQTYQNDNSNSPATVVSVTAPNDKNGIDFILTPSVTTTSSSP